MKKIVVFEGSPRKDGNTALMVNEFVRGARGVGHQVTVFDTAHANLMGCHHCQTCWSKGRACSMEDDFKEMSAVMEAADVIIFAAPMYWSFFPSHLKNVIDKLYAYVVPTRKTNLDGKGFGIITCGDGEDEHAFDMIVPWYKGIAEYMQWNDLGYIAVPKMMEKGDVKMTDALDKAYQMGRNI